MNTSSLREGIVVSYNKSPVEVVSYDENSGLVEIRKLDSSEYMSAKCDDLAEDPQLHTDCKSYY